MAKKIKSTPTLYGEDAKRFRENMDNVKPLPKEEVDRMKKNYNKIKSKHEASEKPSDCSLDVVSKSPFNCKCDNKHKIAEREFYYSPKLNKNISGTLLICLKCGEHHYITD